MISNTYTKEFAFKNVIYCGVYMEAFLDEDKKICKSVKHPYKWNNINEISMKHLKIKKTGEFKKPNAILIQTIKSGLNIIDIDEPENCVILQDLLDDCSFYVKTRKGYHFYYNKNEELPQEPTQCKIADINVNTYFCPEYHLIIDGNKSQSFKYELIKNGEFKDMPKFAVDWCKQLIINTNHSTNKKKSNRKTGKYINPDVEINKLDVEILRHIYDIFYNSDYFLHKDLWFKTAYMTRQINNSEEAFLLFDEYSRKVPKYKNNLEYDNRIAFYGKDDYDHDFDENGILYICKKLDYKTFKKFLSKLYVSKYENEFNQIERHYLFPVKGSVDYQDNIGLFRDWMQFYKYLLIKSAYGTGKTFSIKELIKLYGYKKILFVSYRKSITKSFTSELKNFEFKSYLDKSLDVNEVDRLLIQIDSIEKLYQIDEITQLIKNNDYDLVVLDECESILSHLSFEKINQFTCHNALVSILNNAKKVICFDGDMNDRTYDFISDISKEYKIFINNFKTTKKHFKYTSNDDFFKEKIDNDLKNGNKIAIVSMSKRHTEDYYKLYADKYNVVIHNSFDNNKEVLEDVNTNWKCDLLTFSPTIEAGIDFNVENYFDRCYVVITSGSTTPRGLNQMMNRIRHFKDNNVLCYIGSMKWKTNDVLMRYDEMKLTKYKNIQITNLVKVLIHNDVEKYNSKNFFLTVMTQMITVKGHTYEYLEDAKKQSQIKDEITRENIINALDINDNVFTELLIKQQANEDLTRDENYQLEKHIYKKKWLLPELTYDILDEHYRKNHILKNHYMMNEDKEVLADTEYFKKFKYEKIDKIKSFMNELGYTINEYKIEQNKTINQETFKTKVEEFFILKSNKTLFNFDKQIKKTNHLSLVNELIDDYGYELKADRIKIKDEKDQWKHNLKFELSFIDIISSYHKRKAETKTSMMSTNNDLDYMFD